MKNYFTRSCFLALFCSAFFFTSCSEDYFEGIEENANYMELTEFFETMDSWQSIDYTDLDAIDFSAITDDPNLCPTDYAALIDFEGYEEIESFSRSLGFLNTLSLNDWYVDFGKVYYDLVKEYDPSDKTSFIDEVTEKHLGDEIQECELPIFTNLANKAFFKAKTFGAHFRDGEIEKCKGAALYGYNSSLYLFYQGLKKRVACNL